MPLDRDLVTSIQHLTPRRDYTQPQKYNTDLENQRRHEIKSLAFYAEHGPLYDNDGNYLCATCSRRVEPNGCTWVLGKISMDTGGCAFWQRTEEKPDAPKQIPHPFTKAEANYGERAVAKGFGCGRCEYQEPAREKDSEGRSLWCKMWGLRVMSSACCIKEDGDDLKAG